jgi:hypothetical protein
MSSVSKIADRICLLGYFLISHSNIAKENNNLTNIGHFSMTYETVYYIIRWTSGK